MFRPKDRTPNFSYFIKMLKKEPTIRPVLFDFIIGADKEKMLTGNDYKITSEFDRVVTTIKAFDSAGYDFAPIIVRGLEFTRNTHHQTDVLTKSLNEGAIITDRESFNNYRWPNINNCDFNIIKQASQYLHKDAKFIPFSFDGILENTIGIVGYENLCLMLYDDYNLLKDIFEQVGLRIEQYYNKCLEYDEVGAILCNDDWGFNSQTMLPPDILKEVVFPVYQRIVANAHKRGKYAILHSCGYYNDIMEDIIMMMKFDGRHSYEDKITPVEIAYDQLNPKIAVLGGIDVDFLARANSDEIYKRSKRMILKTKNKGGYALGSGNSVPDYISNENYLSMLKAALEDY